MKYFIVDPFTFHTRLLQNNSIDALTSLMFMLDAKTFVSTQFMRGTYGYGSKYISIAAYLLLKDSSSHFLGQLCIQKYPSSVAKHY